MDIKYKQSLVHIYQGNKMRHRSSHPGDVLDDHDTQQKHLQHFLCSLEAGRLEQIDFL